MPDFDTVDGSVTHRELWRELGCPQRPKEIWQKPFEFDPAHYERLCQRCATDARFPANHDPVDLESYLEDLTYVEETQPDLLLFLLPLCLRAWSWNLLSGTESFSYYAEEFWRPWSKGSPMHGSLFELLSEKQRNAFERYVSDAIIAAIDRAPALKSGAGTEPDCGRWLSELGSFSTVCPGLSQLWHTWWNLETEGRAIGALQYLSCLMYEDTTNPIFPPWKTPHRYGGPPYLWANSMAVNDQPWDPENVSFLKDVLVPTQLLSAIDRCLERLTNAEDRKIAAQMKIDFAYQMTLLELRIEQLPIILSSACHGKWII